MTEQHKLKMNINLSNRINGAAYESMAFGSPTLQRHHFSAGSKTGLFRQNIAGFFSPVSF